MTAATGERDLRAIGRLAQHGHGPLRTLLPSVQRLVGNQAALVVQRGKKPKLTEKRMRHIYDGDSTGGGHRPGGTPGKSHFPDGWGYSKCEAAILQAARNGTEVGTSGSSTTVDGVVDGVRIRVIIDEGGSIITAYPR